MRRIIPIFWLVAITTVSGCSKATPPSNTTNSSFKPNFSIQWPGEPDESLILPGNTGEMKVFMANFTEWNYDKETGQALRDGHATFYIVAVEEYPQKSFEDEKLTPHDMLFAHNFAFQKFEVSRKEIEHGPQKYPGLVIFQKMDKNCHRQLTVMAGNRLYSVSVRTYAVASVGTR